ncbi:MAG TPA: amidophosphoribosyltransferase, partial [Candidatus Saccharimonadia bacterium]|nr:amidophosphoribosyltransferase [Candidatus Saccharimonadia bacterium]
MPELKEKCAVFGVVSATSDSARLTYYGLWALQHRGQESSGIASYDGQEFHLKSGPGLVAHVYNEADLSRLKGKMSIGHNRYATSGEGIQPYVFPEVGMAFAHNGNLPSTRKLEEFLSSHDVDATGLNDSAMMAAAIAWYMQSGKSLVAAVEAAWPLFTGAFSCVAMDRDTVVGFRDECGIRPLSIGDLPDGYVIASETCAFDTVGAAFLR